MKKTINILVMSAIILFIQNTGMAQSVEKKQNPEADKNTKITYLKKADKKYSVEFKRNPEVTGVVKTEETKGGKTKSDLDKEKADLSYYRYDPQRWGLDQNGKLLKTKELYEALKKYNKNPDKLNQYEKKLINIYKHEQQESYKDKK